MEERHREDRRKLGVPEVAIIVSQHRSSRVRVQRQKLALALAAASGVGGEGAEQRKDIQAEVQKMWLPQVSLKRRGKRLILMRSLPGYWRMR